MPSFLPQRFTTKQIAIIIGTVVVAGGLYFAVTSNLRVDSRPPEVKLVVWGPFDEKRALEGVFDSYKMLRPNVQITYQKIDAEDYYATLVNAIAVGKGPDVFMIDNRALPREIEKLAPLYTGYSYPGMQQPISFGIADFTAAFPTVAVQDLTSGGAIYAMPLSIDTLALIYNKDAFDQVSLVTPPVTWTDVEHYIPYLRLLNAGGQIVKAGAAIGGTGVSVKNNTDILNLLMLQTGTRMTDDAHTRAYFGIDSEGGNRGLQALNFYLQFAKASSPYYTWNDAQPYSVDSVGNGRVAMIFGYHEDVASIEKKNPFASIGVAPMPQLEGATLAVNYAKYWGLAVSKQTTSTQGWAWDFIVNFAGNPARAKLYTAATKRPPALRTAIGEALGDLDLGVFAKQALTARSWYEANPTSIDTIFNRAIGAVLRGELDSGEALHRAQDQVTELMNKGSE